MLSSSLIKKLPKADLHSHIDGTIPIKELFKIAKKYNREIKTSDEHEIKTIAAFSKFIRGGGYDSLLNNIAYRFSPITGLMQTEEILREVGRVYVKKLSEDGIIYAEGRIAPQYHIKEGLTIDEVIESLLEGLKEGYEETGTWANLIVAIGREITDKAARKIVSIALKYCKKGVVGIDLVGTEENNPPEKFLGAFRMTFNSKLKRTVHAGEGCKSIKNNLRNIGTSILVLKANGLGHAIHLPSDQKLIRLVEKNNVRIESNPISNLVLGHISNIKDLKIDCLLAQHIKVTINSDDPAIWPNGTLTENFVEVCKVYGFGFKEVDALIMNSFESAFISDKEKEYLKDEYLTIRKKIQE
jgi:adenosine deaminase